MEHFDILIIGGGAAGIAAAKSADTAGCQKIALVDRKSSLGGVLRQCLHRGFGQDRNGQEYAEHLLQGFPEAVRIYSGTTVLRVTKEKLAYLSGAETIAFQQLILATGCREIPMGALPIVGTRPEGVYTAGQMQEMMNLHGYLPEGPAVILGSGDLGLVMAAHLAQAGIPVTLVEQKSSCGGMARNQACLRHPLIRLICHTTVEEVLGEPKLEGCILSTGEMLPCKTLLIAVGLKPEQELIFGLGKPDWLQLCGNCNRVHPMVEAVVHEGKQAGIAAWNNIRGYV